jgi:hypothetical protein
LSVTLRCLRSDRLKVKALQPHDPDADHCLS